MIHSCVYPNSQAWGSQNSFSSSSLVPSDARPVIGLLAAGSTSVSFHVNDLKMNRPVSGSLLHCFSASVKNAGHSDFTRDCAKTNSRQGTLAETQGGTDLKCILDSIINYSDKLLSKSYHDVVSMRDAVVKCMLSLQSGGSLPDVPRCHVKNPTLSNVSKPSYA